MITQARVVIVGGGMMGAGLAYRLAEEGWSDFFNRLVGANDAARDKPAVEAVDLALADSGLRPGPEVWFVGDTDIDMTCAVAASCTPVLLRPEAPAKDEFPGSTPDLHVASCQALLEVIRAL